MAQFCNPEKEGQQGHQEVEKVPSGFGAPRRTSVASHGVLYSGWQPNPERTVMSAPWFRVECCTRWPAHNESYINGLCGHRVHEKHALCVAHTQHTSNEKVGFFTSYLCRVGLSCHGKSSLRIHIVVNLGFCLSYRPSQNTLVCNLRVSLISNISE